MKKILTIIGARPQFIKAAAVSQAIQAQGNLQELVVHTGQHYDPNMSDVFFEEMGLPKPAYQLTVAGRSHGAMTGHMIAELEAIMMKEEPQWVLIYGDTNSTLAGAIAASKLHIPIAHVEAGLRSFNMRMPEEQNRILSDRLSKVLFCPTQQSIDNLSAEGYDKFPIDQVKVGDVMLDAMRCFEPHAKAVEQALPERFVLCTCHRAENTDDPQRLKAIFDALADIHADCPVVLPLHPRTKKMLNQYNIETPVYTIEPVSYLEMLHLLKHCALVLTDSGGLQKEAFFAHKMCLTLRDETEWVELIEQGANHLVGADRVAILQAYMTYKSNAVKGNSQLFGDGQAAQQIAAYFAR